MKISCAILCQIVFHTNVQVDVSQVKETLAEIYLDVYKLNNAITYTA